MRKITFPVRQNNNEKRGKKYKLNIWNKNLKYFSLCTKNLEDSSSSFCRLLQLICLKN